MNRSARMITTFMMILLLSPVAAQAQDPPPTPTDPLKEELTREKEIAELRQKIAEAKAATRAAELPTTDTAGLQGSVAVADGAGYFAELVAYGTLAEAASEIATQLAEGSNSTSKKKIILTDEMELAQKMQLWRLVDGKLDEFGTKFTDLIGKTEAVTSIDRLGAPESVGLTLTSLSSLLGGIADIAAFFKVDVEIKNREIQLAKSALMAEAAKALSKNWTVVLPELTGAGQGALLTKLDNLAGQRKTLTGHRRRIANLVKPHLATLAEKRAELAKKEAELAELKKATPVDQPKVKKVRQEIEDLENQAQPLKNIKSDWDLLSGEVDGLVAAFDQYRSALTESTAERPAPIESLTIVDVIRAEPNAHRLHLDIASQGAEVHVTKSAWSSGRVSYIGGTVCVYFWIDPQDALQYSDSIPIWRGSSFKASKGSEQLNAGH